MRFFKAFLNFFTTITTVITAIMGVLSIIGGYTELSPYIALQILGAGAVTSLLTVIFYSIDFKSKKHVIIVLIIHYCLLCIAMNTLGIMFDWVKADVGGILMMCVYVAIVYVIVYVISDLLMRKEADELNRALNERNKKR